MKTEALDYVLASIALTLLVVIAGGLAAMCALGLTITWLGPYHVMADIMLFLLFFGLTAAAFCRFLVMTSLLRPGSYSMDDAAFRWWKLFTVVYEFGRGALLPYTTVFAKPLIAKLFGARIGRDIALGGHLVDPQFISISDEAIIGHNSVITAHTITSGTLILKPVKIAARATVGVHAIIMSGVEIGEGAIITPGAVVRPDTIIPPGEMWGGVPAKRLKYAASPETNKPNTHTADEQPQD